MALGVLRGESNEFGLLASRRQTDKMMATGDRRGTMGKLIL